MSPETDRVVPSAETSSEAPREVLDLAAEPPKPDELVLPTLNPDGTRRWINPKLSLGRFLTARRIVAWALIALFAALPLVSVAGKPAILLDLPRREFTFFGSTFGSTDTVLLMLLLLSIFVSIFLITALVGRAWCGWACPQTVYLEFLFRPIDRLRVAAPIRWVLYGLAAAFVANVFLAYFVGAQTLGRWITASPLEHPGPFLFMLSVAGLMLFDFAYFREQMCTVICPYARLQSVLLDQRSLVVAYDRTRGEPRGKLRPPAEGPRNGDCIDCGACVRTCPTGIDIREGLQLECVACAQCVDACDAIMDRVERPRGLIRYTSQEALQSPGGRISLWRPRVLLYPVILSALVAVFLVVLGHHGDLQVKLLRGTGTPFTVRAGEVTNTLRLKLHNPSDEAHALAISLPNVTDVNLIVPENPVSLAAGETRTVGLFLLAPAASFGEHGKRKIEIALFEGARPIKTLEHVLLGPREADERAHEREQTDHEASEREESHR